jgi:potassium efflux system protein
MLPINRSQHPVFALLFAMLFFFATAPLTWARADNSNDIPTRADVQSQLDTLNKQKDLSLRTRPAGSDGNAGNAG